MLKVQGKDWDSERMTTEDWVKKLKEKDGVKDWNDFRAAKMELIPEDNDTLSPVLTSGGNPSLRGAHLEGADLEGANFKETDLSEAHLEGANLKGADLEGANLKGSHLEGAHLSFDNNLKGAEFNGADLTGADLTGADLTGADLTGAKLTGIHLEGWQIDHSTKFERVECEYVFLLRESCQNLERCPPGEQNFFSGEFADLQGDLGRLKEIVERKEHRQSLTGETDPLHQSLKAALGGNTTDNLRKQVEYLELRVKSLELQKKLLLLSFEKRWLWVLRQVLLYLFVAVIFCGFSWFFYKKVIDDPQQTLSISVDYDVGTILGGVLIGGAAIFAATTYAMSSSRAGNRGRDSSD